MRRPVVGRLARRRDPDADLWEARQQAEAARLAEQEHQVQEWFAEFDPTGEGRLALVWRLIEQMQAEHLARQWAHRSSLAVEVDLREKSAAFFSALDGLPDEVPH